MSEKKLRSIRFGYRNFGIPNTNTDVSFFVDWKWCQVWYEGEKREKLCIKNVRYRDLFDLMGVFRLARMVGL